MNEIHSTKERPSAFDGFAKAAPDELLFTLLERDPLFVELVLEWADRTRRAAKDIADEDKRAEKLRQCNEAEEVAWEAKRRRKGEPEKVSAATTETYSGNTTQAEPWREQISVATQRLRNAASEISDATTAFDELELLDDDDRVMLGSALGIVKQIASEREPKRASFAKRPTLADIKEGN